jgi:hypothetical protein
MLDDIEIMDKKMQSMCKALKAMGYEDETGDLASCRIRTTLKNKN